MHYSPTSFSKNNKPTIEAKRKTTEEMGQRKALSKKDIKKINAMYKCKGTTASTGYVLNDSALDSSPNGGILNLMSSLFSNKKN